ncbi:MAG: hypothetical protein BGO22_17670 [Hydrogenophaga sp. 70-12]|nr:MAG: hypothetical protein BGO22_17670 [Hydrogenophaga sp. 70-12]
MLLRRCGLNVRDILIRTGSSREHSCVSDHISNIAAKVLHDVADFFFAYGSERSKQIEDVRLFVREFAQRTQHEANRELEVLPLERMCERRAHLTQLRLARVVDE